MTFDEVQSLVREQSAGSLSVIAHGIKLQQALISPRRISLIFRNVVDGKVEDETLDAWLVGQEGTADGYRIVMREDGKQFGLAMEGFPHDEHLVLVGWYGSLLSAFIGM
jgi:hypothetical protein